MPTVNSVMRNRKPSAGISEELKGESRYLTAVEVAERYGMTLGWVYRCKKLPHRKVGKYLVFREDELEKFEQYRREEPRGFFIRHDSKASVIQKLRKALKFDMR